MAAIGRQALTALLPVQPGRESALRAALSRVGPELSSRLSPALTLHFARLVLVPGEPVAGRAAISFLLFETTYDGALGPHLEELFALAGEELGALFAECDGVEPGGDVDAFEATLRRASRPPRAFAAAHGTLSVAKIQRDSALRESVRQLLERERDSFGSLGPLAILVAVRRELGLVTRRVSHWPASREAVTRDDGILWFLKLIPLVVGMLIQDVRERLSGLWHDRSDARLAPSSAGESPTLAVRSLQRAFTLVVPPRPGRFRRGALRRALSLAASALGAGVERGAPGVHGLRFVLLDDGRLLFTHQQDGSLASRLEALGRSAKALAAFIGSNTEGFPRALLRHLAGRADDEQWLEWLRNHEVAAGFCYSAYPLLSARDIAHNAELAELLSADPTEERARRLLELV